LTLGPLRVLSGASVVDTSVFPYGGTSFGLTTQYGDQFTAKNINGKPSNVHTYVNYDTTGQSLGKSMVGAIDSTHYFGVYYVDNSSVNFDINYNFKNLKSITGPKK